MTASKLIFEKIELDFNFREFTFQSGINKLDHFSMNIQANLLNMVILKFIF